MAAPRSGWRRTRREDYAASAAATHGSSASGASEQRAGKRLDQILGDEAGAEPAGGRAVQPDRGGGRLERPACPAPAGRARSRRAHRREPAVASCGGAFALIAARPSGAAITVSAPLSSTTAPLCRAARGALQLAAGLLAGAVEQAGKLALMRGHHAIGERIAENSASRIVGEDGQRVGVEHRALAGGENRQRLVAGLRSDAGARADQRRVAPRVGEQRAERIDARDGLDDDPGQRRGIDRKRRLRAPRP